ncbi:hypothetical protein AB5I41_18845 [Sphingomonas sp. MMS24-JH45]
MLLDLFAAELERARVSVSSLCIAAAVAPTTALRWIGRMASENAGARPRSRRPSPRLRDPVFPRERRCASSSPPRARPGCRWREDARLQDV